MRIPRHSLVAVLAMCCTMPLTAQQPTGTVRGRITDEATQQPISGATVAIGARATQTQADGRYTLSGVPAGTYTVRSRMIGYAQATREVTVGDGQTVDADRKSTRLNSSHVAF